MASSKYYAYYVRGRKIALIQHDYTMGSGQTLGQPGLNAVGARGDVPWKSPAEDVTEGLEIEYAYSPTYSITTAATTQINKFYINGWTVVDGFLTFLRGHFSDVPNWDASPYSAVGDDEHIVIKGSARWNGLHKVKAGGTDGTLQTYTKVHKSVPIASGSSNVDIAAESDGLAYISTNTASGLWLNGLFSAGDYIFVAGSAQAVNNGFWQVDSVAGNVPAEAYAGIYVDNRYYCHNAQSDLADEQEDTTPNTTATDNESVTIYKAYRDFCYLISDIDTLNDEADVIDLPDYLAKALVYYVKAKVAEDRMDLEQKEYNMREFKRLLEKNESSKIWGARRIGTDETAIK